MLFRNVAYSVFLTALTPLTLAIAGCSGGQMSPTPISTPVPTSVAMPKPIKASTLGPVPTPTFKPTATPRCYSDVERDSYICTNVGSDPHSCIIISASPHPNAQSYADGNAYADPHAIVQSNTGCGICTGTHSDQGSYSQP